jgi:hypothetical protein
VDEVGKGISGENEPIPNLPHLVLISFLKIQAHIFNDPPIAV